MAQLPLIAIVLGGATSVWSELAAARQLAPEHIVIGTNHAARDFDGPLHSFVSMHAEILGKWIAERRAKGFSDALNLWSAEHRGGGADIHNLKRIRNVGGSSGLLAVRVAIEIGADKIILCGVPMCQNGRHYDRSMKWQEAAQYLPAWHTQLPRLKDKVRSFSGETFKMFGAPTREWLYGDQGRGPETA
jgi:hypothetical protein